MKIALTGASSFSGLWFAEALAARGHAVTALLLRAESEYEGIRKLRIQRLKNSAELVFNSPFGSDIFFSALDSTGPFDLFCHHAADVTNYKSPDFDYVAALMSNTRNIRKVMDHLREQNCRKVLLTGSVFEQREGVGSTHLSAVSPYGLSKGLTSDVFTYFSEMSRFHMGKFVIPNPFGPYEEGRFTTYLAKCWLNNQKAAVSFPEYVRDNIPVSLLARSYVAFAEALASEPGFSRLSPSFQPETQGAFVAKFAAEMRKRWHKPCDFDLLKQTEFPEPQMRINSDPIDCEALQWDESSFWDALAEFYLMREAVS